MTDPAHIAAGVRPPPTSFDDAHWDRLPVAFLILDRSGAIRRCNVAASTLLGWRRDRLRGQRLHRWLVPDHLERFDRHLRRTFDLPGEVTREVVRVKTRDGRLEDVSLQCIVDDFDAGACRTVAIDVTDRVRAEREARLLQQELAHIARINSMGEFAGSLAHELNQPLGAVVLYCRTALKLARSEGTERERLLGVLERAIRSAETAGATLRHLNRFLRKNSEERELVHLDHLVAETVRIMQASAEDQECSVQLEAAGSPVWAWVDRIQIEQVLINLMQNAIEAMVAGGIVPRKLVVSTHADADGQVGISVRDNGPGVSAALRERIFEPFFTTKENGLGLGLSISQSIIEAHSGRLWVESSNASAAAFHLRIPGVPSP